ncbi:MAG: hypothetical protein LWW74_01275 [Burkholderiales bacterium]|nr:hypothetical protein [Burkholderiales bacterium]
MTAFGASCPHCETLFKVYPDQLRLHNGFANCGSCGRTFDVQAVLIFLPPHETSFLERNTPMVDGLPVLNAVAQVVRNDRSANKTQASGATEHAAQSSTEPAAQQASTTSENTTDLPDSDKHTTQTLAKQASATNPSTTIEPDVVPHTRTFNPVKWFLYGVIATCALIVVLAVVRPEQLRSFTHALKQKIVQVQPLAQYMSTAISSFLP